MLGGNHNLTLTNQPIHPSTNQPAACCTVLHCFSRVFGGCTLLVSRANTLPHPPPPSSPTRASTLRARLTLPVCVVAAAAVIAVELWLWRTRRTQVASAAAEAAAAPKPTPSSGEQAHQQQQQQQGQLRGGLPVDGLSGCIGGTPMIELKSLSRATGCRILGKAEFLNPGGSSKDRVARQMVIEAEEVSAALGGKERMVLDLGLRAVQYQIHAEQRSFLSLCAFAVVLLYRAHISTDAVNTALLETRHYSLSSPSFYYCIRIQPGACCTLPYLLGRVARGGRHYIRRDCRIYWHLLGIDGMCTWLRVHYCNARRHVSDSYEDACVHCVRRIRTKTILVSK